MTTKRKITRRPVVRHTRWTAQIQRVKKHLYQATHEARTAPLPDRVFAQRAASDLWLQLQDLRKAEAEMLEKLKQQKEG